MITSDLFPQEAIAAEAMSGSHCADTHLSLCSAYSSLQQHEAALSAASDAVAILSSKKEKSTRDSRALAIAHYNMGAALEACGRVGAAMERYATASSIAAGGCRSTGDKIRGVTVVEQLPCRRTMNCMLTLALPWRR